MLKLDINGKTHEVPDAAGTTPLLWVLRDQLNLVGTKYGCGGGFCGACTVHLDGRPVRACQTATRAAGGKAVTTVEGLGTAGKLHPLQQAWIDHDVPQCGYCQSGQLMSAAALLARKPAPSDTDIDSALAGNLCRCGTYIRIRAAIHDAAKAMQKRGAEA